ncbi:MAG: PadR family transcriptional regulator [Thermoplasmata archaeon]
MIEKEWARELRKGSIQLCILTLLNKQRKYGFQISRELKELSNDYFDIKEGTLYPALHILEKRGYLKSEWVDEGTGTPKKYYSLTDDGRAYLREVKKEWYELNRNVRNVLEAEK